MKKALAVAALAVLSAAPARAHHPGTETDVGHAGIREGWGVTAATARMEHDGDEADVRTLTFAVEQAVAEDWSLGGKLPLARVHPEGGASRSGIGDLDVFVKSQRRGPAGSLWSAGLGVELPTGDHAKGLGAGHFGISPFAAFGAGRWHGGLAAILSAGSHEDGHEPNLLSPHAGRELNGHLGAFFRRGAAYLNAVAGVSLPMEGEDSGRPFAELRPEFGVSLSALTALSAGVRLPVTEARRAKWGFGLQFRRKL